jgi:hypothetical protein
MEEDSEDIPGSHALRRQTGIPFYLDRLTV